jgi:neutral amino acid transport system permease protein
VGALAVLTERSPRRAAGVAMVLAAVMSLALPGLAQDGAGVTVTLQYTDPATGERTPVAGAGFSVSDEAGELVGSDVTDAEGVVLIPVPGRGVYTIEIDPATLPEGVALSNPDRTTATVDVQEGETVRALFALAAGEGAGAGGGITLNRVLQLTFDGLKEGLFLAMMAIGLSLIFGTTGLVNFAHAEMVTWGMLVAYFFNLFGLVGVFGFMEGWPAPFGGPVELIAATAIAVAFGGLMGWAFDAGIFRRLRNRGTSLIAQMVVSIGLAIVVRYTYLYIFGGSPRFFRSYAGQEAISLGPVQVVPKNLVAMIITVIVLVLVGLSLQRTRTGRSLRAVADNRDLAESSGIDVQKVIQLVWVAGGGLAAMGGVFFAQSNVIQWDGGSRILLLIFAGVTLGGLGTAYGALVGSVVVGLGISLSTLFIPVELKNIGALILLAVILLVRPQGILGQRERIG